jgi:hypothetical protein
MAGVFKSGARFVSSLAVATLLVSAAFAQHYTRTDLTTNSSSVSAAPVIDPNLVNPWGLSRATSSPWWVSDNGTGVSTLYNAAGDIIPLVVTIPPPEGPRRPARSTTSPPVSKLHRGCRRSSFSLPRTGPLPDGIPT